MADRNGYPRGVAERIGPTAVRLFPAAEFLRAAYTLGYCGARTCLLRERIETAEAIDLVDAREAAEELERLGDEVPAIEARMAAVRELKRQYRDAIPEHELDKVVAPVPCRRTRNRIGWRKRWPTPSEDEP
jgi:hypothetical protein